MSAMPAPVGTGWQERAIGGGRPIKHPTNLVAPRKTVQGIDIVGAGSGGQE